MESQSVTDSIDLSPNRPFIQRFKYVVDHFLNMVPENSKKDVRIQVFLQLIKDAIKDLALVPDEIMIPIATEVGHAFLFVAEGDMEELLEHLEEGENAAQSQ
jgi:hypothetical protein